MIPYFAVLVSVVTLAYLRRHTGSAGGRRLSISAIVILLSLFAGLRDRSVGTDTGNYIHMFASVTSYADIWRTTEIGYNALMVVCSGVSHNYAFLLTAIAFIVVGSYVSGIVRLVSRYDVSLFLFIALGTYTFFFNGARQGIAAGLCFAALPSLLDRRPVPYFLLVSLAALFHHSALIAAPLYFLAVPRVGWRQLLIVVVGTAVMVVLLKSLVQISADLLSDRYATYATAGEGGGTVAVSFLVFQGLLLFMFRYQVSDPMKYYCRLLNIYLLGLIPALAAVLSSVNPSGLLRLSLYFSPVTMLLWPMLFTNIKSRPLHGAFMLGFLAVSVAYFILTTTAFSNLVPYRINEAFSWRL